MRLDNLSDLPRNPSPQPDGPGWETDGASLKAYVHQSTGVWFGRVDVKGRPTVYFQAASRDLLVSEMEASFRRPPPRIYSLADARKRFLEIYPGGYENAAYQAGERGGKVEASALLAPILEAGTGVEIAIELMRKARTLLSRGLQAPLHLTEASDLDAVWRGPSAAVHIDGLRRWAAGDREAGLELTLRALDGVRQSWPMVTLFPALLNPRDEAILRPMAVRVFARAVRPTFDAAYDSTPNKNIYEDYLEMLEIASRGVMDLAPQDNIDLTNLVWISTSYDADIQPRGE